MFRATLKTSTPSLFVYVGTFVQRTPFWKKRKQTKRKHSNSKQLDISVPKNVIELFMSIWRSKGIILTLH